MRKLNFNRLIHFDGMDKNPLPLKGSSSPLKELETIQLSSENYSQCLSKMVMVANTTNKNNLILTGPNNVLTLNWTNFLRK